MRRALHFSFFSVLLCSVATLYAQNDRFAYAITDVTAEGTGWNTLRKLDLKTGEYSNVLLNGREDGTTVYQAGTKKELTQKEDAKYGKLLHAPFGTGVAAAAYDKKHNRLYYTPMFIDQLRYVDLKTMKVYYVTDEAFTGLGNMHNDEAKCITRMVIAPDGYGYALSNDGNTFVQFSTGKKASIKQLGSLVDDPTNGGISIHNSCSSFGGDMIADDKGNLIILSARNHAFTIDIESKVARHLGSIKGLPANFTVNGAVVDGDGNLLVSSAMSSKAYYVVNPKSWDASIYPASSVFRASDLANSNFLSSRTSPPVVEAIAARQSVYSNLIQVFPNPVVNNNFTLQFNQVPVGDYTLELMDVMGRRVFQKQVSVGNEFVTHPVLLTTSNARGVYLVKVLDKARKSVFEQKILVQ